MRRITPFIAFVAFLGLAALPSADAAASRTATYRYTANGHLMPGGAIADAALRTGGNNGSGVSVVPRSSRMTVVVDDAAALDGQYVAVAIWQGSRTVFWDCMQVRRARAFNVTPNQPLTIDVHTLPPCPAGGCSMPLVDVNVRIGDNGVTEPGYRVRSTIPVCSGSPPWSSGTTGTMTVAS